ncbi:MAG: TrbC/VirB2 family protein [Candidatus Altiarchaeota archaeon]|nr:TrbC/VirB2 family protein [Candidatus Altiarchaeota archaeon]
MLLTTFGALTALAAEETRAAYGISCVLCRIANLVFLIIAALASIVIILAGLKWLTSGDDPGARNAAKTTIVSAFVGIIIVFIAVFVVAWVMDGLGGSFDKVRVEDWINSNECDNQCALARGYSEAPTTEETPAEPEDLTIKILSAGEKEDCDVDECGGRFGIGVENCFPHEICKNGDCVFSEVDCCSQQCGEAECPTLSGVVSCNPSFERCTANEAGTACECRIVENDPCCSGECGEKTCLYPDGKAYECWGSEKCITRDDLKGCSCSMVFDKWGSLECDGYIPRPGEERPLSEEQPESRTEDQKLSVLSVDEETDCGVDECGGTLGFIGVENCDPHEICVDGDCTFSSTCCSGECGEQECSTTLGVVSCGSAEKCVPNSDNPSTATACACRITYDKDKYAECCHGRCPAEKDNALNGECSDGTNPPCGTECECLSTGEARFISCTDNYPPIGMPGYSTSTVTGCFNAKCGTYCGSGATKPCEDNERCMYMEDKYQCVEDPSC